MSTKDFVLAHLDEDVRTLALRGCKDSEVDFPFALQQIAGRQRIRHKLPEIYENPDWLLPPTLNLEQASSELTAKYKARLIPGGVITDLTGGMGIDSYYCHATHYVDRNAELCELARQNMPWLEVHCMNSEDYLAQMEPVDVILLDPARRDKAGRKVAALRDCTPDVVELLPLLREKCRTLLLKLSPMLDWHQALRDIGCRKYDLEGWEVHVLSVGNDCKELLLVQGPETKSGRVVCEDLQWNQHFDFTLEEEEQAEWQLSDGVGKYLYEPNAAVMKAGCFKTLARTGALSISSNTHLYTSDRPISDFPGRQFVVLEVLSFNKEGQKRVEALGRAAISCRNFPLTAEQLRKKVGLDDGGELQIWGFSGRNNEKKLVISKKM